MRGNICAARAKENEVKTIAELYAAARHRFPDITIKTDRAHARLWGDVSPDFAYSWFGSLANVLNTEMNQGVDYSAHSSLFTFMAGCLRDCTPEAHNCIDVSFVENLFWQVPSNKAAPYWTQMPEPLKDLYLGFHRSAPA